MLAGAGLLDGSGRLTFMDVMTRYAIGGGMLAGWLLYFYMPRRPEA